MHEDGADYLATSLITGSEKSVADVKVDVLDGHEIRKFLDDYLDQEALPRRETAVFDPRVKFRNSSKNSNPESLLSAQEVRMTAQKALRFV